MPLPVGVSVAMMSAIKGAKLLREAGAQERRAQVAGGADLQRDVALADDALEVPVRHRSRTAVDVKRHMRPERQQMVAGDGARARNRRAAGVHGRDHVVRARGRDQRRVFVGARKGAEAGLGEPDALLRNLAEIVAGEPRLENDRARMHGHAARPVAARSICARRPRAP